MPSLHPRKSSTGFHRCCTARTGDMTRRTQCPWQEPSNGATRGDHRSSAQTLLHRTATRPSVSTVIPTASQPRAPSSLRVRTASEGSRDAVGASNGGRATIMYSHAVMAPFLPDARTEGTEGGSKRRWLAWEADRPGLGMPPGRGRCPCVGIAAAGTRRVRAQVFPAISESRRWDREYFEAGRGSSVCDRHRHHSCRGASPHVLRPPHLGGEARPTGLSRYDAAETGRTILVACSAVRGTRRRSR